MENKGRILKTILMVVVGVALAGMAQAQLPTTASFTYALVGAPDCPAAVATAQFEKTPDYSRFRVDVYNITCADAIDYFVNGHFVATRQTHDGYADLGMDTRYNNTSVPLMGPDALIEVRAHGAATILLTDRPQDPPAEGEGEGQPSTSEGEGEPTTGTEGEGEPTTGQEGEGEGQPSTSEGEGEPTTGTEGEGEPTTGQEGEGEPQTGEGEGEGQPSTGEGEGEGQVPPTTLTVQMRQSAGSNGYYYAGQDLLVRVKIRAEQNMTVSALGVSETLPAGWLVTDIVSANSAAVKPSVGDGGTINFAWIDVPLFPVELAYHVSVPADATGNYVITGETLYRTDSSGQLTTGIISTPVVPGQGTEHCTTADTNHDWNISMSEVLRLVQLYNSGQFHCDATSEDGYAPGPGEQVCTLHNSDHLTPDFKIELSELLRLIQFYNVGSFHCDASGEDGYAPGPGDQTCAPHQSDYNPTDWLISLSELLRMVQLFNAGGYEPCSTGEDGFCPVP